MNMTLISNLLVLMFIKVILQYTLAAPVTKGRWVNPCGGDTAIPILPIKLPALSPRNISQQLATLRIKAREAEDACDQVLDSIVTSSLTTTYVAAELQSKPVLIGFPETGPFYTSGMDVEAIIQNATERASKLEVFLEQALLDTMQDYKVELKKLEDNNVDILCNMHAILKGQSKDVTSSVSRDIFPKNSTNLNLSDTDDRNYLIIRDSKKLYKSIAEDVGSYLKDHST